MYSFDIIILLTMTWNTKGLNVPPTIRATITQFLLVVKSKFLLLLAICTTKVMLVKHC